MYFDEYQEFASQTAIYPEGGEGTLGSISYAILGLTNEAGEVAGKWKKVIRDDGGVLSKEKADAIADELSDVLWYCAAVASECGFSLDSIARHNLDKLNSRKERGVLGGSGDTR